MKTVKMEVPEHLYKHAGIFVKEGWFRDEQKFFMGNLGTGKFGDVHSFIGSYAFYTL